MTVPESLDGGAGGSGFTAEDVRRCVEQQFCRRDADRPLKFSRRQTPEAMVGARIYRFPMLIDDPDSGEDPCTLSVFVNPDELGQRFWSQEMRAMIRLGGIGHPALPEVHDGGTLELDGSIGGITRIAYVLTAAGEGTLSEPEARLWARQNPLSFYVRLQLLADALVVLHRDGLLHRNIKPASVGYEDIAGRAFALRLGHFEMSSLLADALRRGVEISEDTGRAALGAFIEQGPEALACIAPERLTYLLATGDFEDLPERSNGDVYALGVVAFQCLVAELDPDRLAAAFPPGVAPNDFTYRFDRDAWRRLHGWMRERVADASIGATLRRLLLAMLEGEPDKRPGSLQLLEMLNRDDPQVREELEPREGNRERLVAVEPTQFTLLQEWGWLSGEPLTTRGGSDMLIRFLREDLADAWFEFAPDELMRYVHRSVKEAEMPLAKYVLRGRLGYYYGHLYKNRNPRNASDPKELKHVFMIRWVLRRELVDRDTGGRAAPRIGRRIAPLKIVSHRAESVSAEGAQDYPSWEPELDVITIPHRRSENEDNFMGALRWLARHQRAEIEARRYPYIRVDEAAGSGRPTTRVQLRYDAERDAKWLAKDAVRNQYALNKDRRPDFGDFFNPGRDRGFEGKLRCWPDAEGTPKRDERSFSVEGEIDPDSTTPDCIVMDVEDPDAFVPLKGWVEPADDEGQMTAFDRQSEASLHSLPQRPVLVSRLLDPQAFLRYGEAWRQAAQGLTGDRAPAVIRRALAADPIYVLQGPPGTGKTMVVSRAVVAAIQEDPRIRILVSAQSHYALDNLALAIRKALPDDSTIAVRLVSDATDTRVDKRLKPWTRDSLLVSRPREVKAHVAAYLASQGLAPADHAIVQKWHDAIDQAALEIVDRTFAGANIVFATCLHSATTGPFVPERPDQFDWVIVEEAAKALPSELAVPLIRGPRWTLVGDHFQLSPYRVKEIEEFLTECADALRYDKGLTMLLQGADGFRPYFKLFERMFEKGTREDPENKWQGYEKRPVDVLNTQFRMTPPIGDLVSKAFYKGKLRNGRELQPVETLSIRDHIPKWFGEHRLIWLNTDDESSIFGNGQYADGEVAIVARLVREMWKGRTPAPHELAILTPYRRQRAAIVRALGDELEPLVHTVDSFQGREADVVIASLVRGYPRVTPTTIYSRIGHLADEQRVNVMLSRAREFLVFVGQFRHFFDAGRSVNPGEKGSFWVPVCDQIRAHGLRRSTVEQFGPFTPGRT